MRTYKVKEAHLGDKPKPYEPGDTRELSAADAKTLIGLGLIEDPDASSAPPVEQETPEAKAERMQADGWISLDKFNDLAARHEFNVEALATERTASEGLAAQVDTLNTSVSGLNDQISALTTDRDAFRDQVTALTTERDGLRDQLAAMTAERDDLAAQVAAQTTPDASKPAKGK